MIRELEKLAPLTKLNGQKYEWIDCTVLWNAEGGRVTSGRITLFFNESDPDLSFQRLVAEFGSSWKEILVHKDVIRAPGLMPLALPTNEYGYKQIQYVSNKAAIRRSINMQFRNDGRLGRVIFSEASE